MNLVILKTAAIPAVLLECGVILNRDEEVRLRDRVYQAGLVMAVAAGVEKRAPVLMTKRVDLQDDSLNCRQASNRVWMLELRRMWIPF